MEFKGDFNKDGNSFKEICSRQTICSITEGFFYEFATVMKGLVGMKWIETVFKDIDNDEDRLRAIYTNDILKEHLHETLNHVNTFSRDKDPVTAKMRRMDATDMISCGQYESALSLINISVLRSPSNFASEAVDYGSSLLLAYMKRAEIFTCMKDYKLALEDLYLAEETNDVPPKMRDIIRLKKEDLKSRIEGKETCPIEIPSTSSYKLQHYPRLTTNWELPQITCGNNPKLINASAKVDIRETEYAGKEIYAKENIAPGEVLLIEEPSVSFLLHKFHGTHCSECFIRLYAPIGCPDCVNVAFCSRKCRDIALSTYHKYECKILLLMFGSGMSSLSYLAFRAITQEGLDNCLKIYDAINKKDKTNEQNDDNNKENEEKLSRSARRRRKLKNKLLTKTQTSDTSNLSDNLASISLKEKESPIDTRLYELVNHNSERKSSDFFERTLMTAFLLKCLQRIHFFKTTSPDNEVPNDDEIKVASLIFKNLQSFQFNAHMIFDIILKSDNILGDKLSENIALAVYPTVSRFNHDCVLSSGRYHIGKKVVIRALKTFQPGESVPENYGPKIDENNCMERQMLLMGRYWFKCTCKACVEKWPTADNLTNNMAKLKCPTKGCYKLYKIDQITDKPIFCNMCRKKVDMFAVLNLLYACEVKYKKAFQLIEKNEILTPIKYLSEALDEFYKIAVPPHNLTHKSQVMLYYLYSYFGNTYKLPIIKLDKFHSDYFNMKRNSNIQMSV